MELKQLLGDPTWLFEFGLPICRFDPQVDPKNLEKWDLSADYLQPRFFDLSDQRSFAEVMLAWNSNGFFLQCDVPGKSNKSSRDRHIVMSLFLDTRCSPGVHRATSFCHRFNFLGSLSALGLKPGATQTNHGELIPLQRAKAFPNEVHPRDIYSAMVGLNGGGYSLRAFLATSTLTGYDPEEHPDIGVFYMVSDSLLGVQTMARTSLTPSYDDPSLWCRGKLTGYPTKKTAIT